MCFHEGLRYCFILSSFLDFPAGALNGIENCQCSVESALC